MHDALDGLLLSSIGEAAHHFLGETHHLTPKIGQKVSQYTLIEQIGEGGMGIVFKARDEKLGRFVALKFLMPTLGGSRETTQRLEREARAASALNHPSICTIHDFIEDGEQCSLVMEYLEGQTLKERLEWGPLPEPEALRIALAVASALEAAHRKNIVHCDIKPANIFLTIQGNVKVLDFGIARLRRDAATVTRESEAGRLAVGTRAYMSPEQARGEELDERTDIFSLGVVLKDMLASPGSAVSRVIEKMTRGDRTQRYQKYRRGDDGSSARGKACVDQVAENRVICWSRRGSDRRRSRRMAGNSSGPARRTGLDFDW